jgi:hypothetical protein
MIMLRLLTLACAALLAVPASAHAEERARAGGYGTSFAGGVLIPLRDMTTTHQQGLAAGLRMGYTGRSGLGLDLAAEYSPLPRRMDADSTGSFETHFATAALVPRFTLGKGWLRLWLGAGGGVAFEYERQLAADGVAVLDTSTSFAPAGMGAAGVELHIVSGVGLTAMGSYTQTMGDLAYEFVTVTGGLLLTFR